MRNGRTNTDVARALDETATLLEAQDADRFRVRAYRQAARTVRELPGPVAALEEREGPAGLDRIPGVGRAISRAISDYLRSGRMPMLERLRGESGPVAALATLPGVGRVLAERLHAELGIDTLEDLETAAHDGRLRGLPGFGPKRVAALIGALEQRLGRPRDHRGPPPPLPAVRELLEVDARYRADSAAGRLPLIAPRRFNPRRTAWLPVLHLRLGPRRYTALYSNTALAHQLGRTHDWVVIYLDGAGGERAATVVTARAGLLKGRRIVRGREPECAAHYHLAPRRRRRYPKGVFL